MKNGDIGAYLDSLTPEAQETMLKMFSGKSEREIAEILQNEVQALKALRLDRVRDVSDASVSFVLFSEESDDGTVRTRNEAVATFTNIGGIWKSTGLY